MTVQVSMLQSCWHSRNPKYAALPTDAQTYRAAPENSFFHTKIIRAIPVLRPSSTFYAELYYSLKTLVLTSIYVGKYKSIVLSKDDAAWGDAHCLPPVAQFSTPNPQQGNLGHKDFTCLYFLTPQPKPEAAQEPLGDAPSRTRTDRASAFWLLGTPTVWAALEMFVQVRTGATSASQHVQTAEAPGSTTREHSAGKGCELSSVTS